jgi:hypothetical protein
MTRHQHPMTRQLRQRPTPASIPDQAAALVSAYRARQAPPRVTLYRDAGIQACACLARTLAESDGGPAGAVGLEPSRLLRRASKGESLSVHQRAAVRAEAGSILRLCGWSVEWRDRADLDQ